jgi:Na+/phosphate symporter
MQRLFHQIFCISFVIVAMLIYGNLIVLLMNIIKKDKSFLQNYSSYLINTNTTIYPNLKIHYPTMLILFEDDNIIQDM